MTEPPAQPAEPVAPSLVSPAPEALEAGDGPQVSEREVLLTFAERRWRVRGLGKASSFDLLRVNLMCSVPDGRGGLRFHVDTLDLYAARARAAFVLAAVAEPAIAPDVVKRDLGRVLLACEQLADDVVTAAQAPEPKQVAPWMRPRSRGGVAEPRGPPGLRNPIFSTISSAITSSAPTRDWSAPGPGSARS